MPGQISPYYLANKDVDSRTVQLSVDVQAGYAVGYDGALAVTAMEMQGITRQNGLAGDFVAVTTQNTASAIMGAAVVQGDDLAVGVDGKLVAAVAGDRIVGKALMDCDPDLFITIEIKTEGIKA